MSLLTVVQASCDRLGLTRPSVVISSTDQQVRSLLGLAQQEGKELSEAHDWQSLTKEKTITATATEEQTGGIPSDFGRFINNTFYNRTVKRRVEGPLTQTQWAAYKASTATVLFDAFRVRGDTLLLAPTPTAGDSYAYEYVSKWWCTTEGGTAPTQEAWAADTDAGILPEELMTLGIIWRFRQAKGLDYSESFRTYEMRKEFYRIKDKGARDVFMANPRMYRGPRYPQFPDGSWSLS